jgi:type IV pilus assembly protein PilQ
VVTKTNRTEEGSGADKRIREETTTTVETVAASSSAGGPLILKGLSVVTDDRLNTITLIGEPSLVELATSLSRQLDLRQRQVAVNVKVIDVTLNNNSSFTSSFSVGVGDNAFIVNEAGNAGTNFGTLAPSTISQADGTTGRPVISNPYSAVPLGVDFNQITSIPSAPGQGIQLKNGTTQQIVGEIPVTGGTYARVPFLTSNGLQSYISNISGNSAGTLTFTDTNGNGVFDPADTITNFTNASLGTITSQLPSIIQYPSDLLLRLRAQVVSQNAKILTDPTLIIQENQTATVNLTAKTLTNVTETTTTNTNAPPTVARTFTYDDVGLLLPIAVKRIDDNGFVTLEIQPRVSVPGAPVTLTLTSGNQIVNQVSKRELNSGTIRLRDGQPLVLAGIIQENDTATATKWPILGDIPIIGALFRKTTNQKQRSEVVIVVTPQILDDSDNSTFGYGYTPSPEVQRLLNAPKK